MGKTITDMVDSVLRLEHVLNDIDDIFEKVQKQYKMSKEEILILLTLWQEGSMTLKEMDDFVQIKSYKRTRSEEHTSELQSRGHLVCRLLLEKKKNYNIFENH